MAQLRTEISDTLEAVDRRPWLSRGAALGLGGVMALGLAPFHLPLISVLALALALRLHTRTRSRREAIFFGWALGLGYFLVALQWIVEPFLVDAARHGWMAPFAIIAMAGGLAMFWALAFGVSWGLGHAESPRRAAWAILALTAAEGLRSSIFTGFPWALIGSIWVAHPLGQVAALIGPHGLTLFTGALAVGLLTLSMWRSSRRALLASGITVLAWGGGTFYGERVIEWYDVWAATQAEAETQPVVRIIQPNETQALKWQREMIPVFWDRKLALTSAPAVPAPDVIIWPEVSVPYFLPAGGGEHLAMAEAAQGATVLAGFQRLEDDNLYNALVAVAPSGLVEAIYDKHHLVPFGEYMPGRPIADRLGLQGLATDLAGNFSPGPGPAVLDLGPLGQVLPLICYEAIFPRHSRTDPDMRPDWIVHITNDAWFGQLVGPQQHLDQARMRAIEQGLPLVRSANTGISALIDPVGRIVAQVPMDKVGSIDERIPLAKRSTLYARGGNWTVAFLWLAVALWLYGNRTRKQSH